MQAKVYQAGKSNEVRVELCKSWSRPAMDTAIRKAIAYLSRITGVRFPPDLYADMYQQAALRIVECGAQDPRSMFRSARCGVSQEYNRALRDMRAEAALLAVRRAGKSGGLSPEIKRSLADLFLKSRAKRGDRGQAAAQRDTQIVDLLTRGYSDDGIALEMGVTYFSVREYRKIIKNNLKKALDKRRKT